MAGNSIYNLTAWIGADVRDFTTNVQRAMSVQEKFHESVKMLGKGIAATFSVAAIGSFVKSAVTDFAQLELAQIRLGLAFKGSADELKKLHEYASLREEQTVFFQEETILAAANAFKNFGLSAEQIKLATDAAIKLANATGKDLPEATEMLLKTFNGQTRAIKEAVPEVLKLTDAQLKHGEAVNLVNEKYKGINETLAESTAGKLQALSNWWDNLKKTVGGAIVDIGRAVKTGAEYFAAFQEAGISGAKAWHDHSKALKEASKEIGDAAENIGKLNLGNTRQAETLKSLNEHLKDLKDRFEETELYTAEWYRLGKEIEQTTAKIKKAQEAIGKLNKETGATKIQLLPETGIQAKGAGMIGMPNSEMQASINLMDQLHARIDALKPKLIDISDTMRNILGDAIISLSESFGELFGKMDVKSFGEGVVRVITNFMRTLGGLFVTMGVAAINFKASLATLNGWGMVAAGAALIAGASAINALVSKGIGGGGGGGGISAPAYAGYSSGVGSQKINISMRSRIRGSDIELVQFRSQRDGI